LLNAHSGSSVYSGSLVLLGLLGVRYDSGTHIACALSVMRAVGLGGGKSSRRELISS